MNRSNKVARILHLIRSKIVVTKIINWFAKSKDLPEEMMTSIQLNAKRNRDHKCKIQCLFYQILFLWWTSVFTFVICADFQKVHSLIFIKS